MLLVQGQDLLHPGTESFNVDAIELLGLLLFEVFVLLLLEVLLRLALVVESQLQR